MPDPMQGVMFAGLFVVLATGAKIILGRGVATRDVLEVVVIAVVLVGASILLEPMDDRDTSLLWVLTTSAVVFEASQLRAVPRHRKLIWIAFAGVVLIAVMVTGVPPWP